MPYSLTTHDMPRQPTMLPRNPVTPPSSIPNLSLRTLIRLILQGGAIRLALCWKWLSSISYSARLTSGSTATNDAQCTLRLGIDHTPFSLILSLFLIVFPPTQSWSAPPLTRASHSKRRVALILPMLILRIGTMSTEFPCIGYTSPLFWSEY